MATILSDIKFALQCGCWRTAETVTCDYAMDQQLFTLRCCGWITAVVFSGEQLAHHRQSGNEAIDVGIALMGARVVVSPATCNPPRCVDTTRAAGIADVPDAPPRGPRVLVDLQDEP